ncbi:MAG: adenine phosphoribosyltransferase [Polyangiales bacterium]
MSDKRMKSLRGHIRDVPDFPRKGILFKDITPLLADVEAFRACIQLMVERLGDESVSAVVGIESRGFMFGAALADKLGVGFIPVRKPGKLPAATFRAEYDLEYGSDAVEIHQDALRPGDRVVVVDDLIATGGTAKATGDLVQKCGAEVAAFVFVINLVALEGVKKLAPARIITILDY